MFHWSSYYKGYEEKQNSCVDIDECNENTHGCAADEPCNNTIGSYKCYCDVFDYKFNHNDFGYQYYNENFKLYFKADGIWNKGYHWGYLQSTEHVGDQVIRKYADGSQNVNCKMSSKLTYLCGDTTKVTWARRYNGGCYFEAAAQVVCKC